MEVSGHVFRSVPSFSGVVGGRIDTTVTTHSSKSSSLSFHAGNQFSGEFSGELKLFRRSSEVSTRFGGKSSSGFLNCGVSDNGSVEFYESPLKTTKEKEKKKKMKKNSEIGDVKKKKKLIKGLFEDLLMFSSMGFGLNSDQDLVSQVKSKTISEATDVLLEQLKVLKAEEKEMKRKKKEEKMRFKKVVDDSECSSSSGSESECKEIVDVGLLRTGGMADRREVVEVVKEQMTMQVQGRNEKCCTTTTSITSTSSGGSVALVAQPNQRIEICMGGKCKKSGAAALMEEFEKKVGIVGAVVGCKCMGKCRDGPNVRVMNRKGGDVEEMVVETDVRRPVKGPICIGVGLEDVDAIVASFFGDEMKDFGMMTATT